MYGNEKSRPKNEAIDGGKRRQLSAVGDAVSIRSTSTVSSKSKKGPEIPQLERKNWFIHLHFLRNEYTICQTLIESQLKETQGMCEYALYIKGLINRQEGKLQDSLGLFRTCTILNAGNVANIKQVARTLFLLGRHKAASEVYEEASIMKVKDWDIWHNLGQCYQSLDELEKAKECFRNALQWGKREESFLSLGNVCILQKDQTSAIEVYRRALDYFPDSPKLHVALGQLFLPLGNYQRAFEHIGSALTFDPTNQDALLAVGAIMQKNNDFDVALSKYRPVAALAPDSAALWNNIGMCFFGRKKYVAAISCLKRALYLAPLEWKILYNLGLVHLTMQQYASAFHFLSAAINLQPTVGRIFMLLAISLSHLEDTDNARLAYEQAIELNKTDPTVCLNYAILLFNLNEYSLCAQQLSAYEYRIARFCQATLDDADQELLETANQLGMALAAVEAHKSSEQPNPRESHLADS